jgi:hypothetical protein
MRSNRVRLLVLALVLTASAIAAVPRPAAATCGLLCWRTTASGGVCCRVRTCAIICSP